MGRLISVLIPVYNTGTFLSAAIDSLRAQTWADWEGVFAVFSDKLKIAVRTR